MHHSTPRNSGAVRPSRRHFLLAGVTGVGAMALAGTAEAATVEVDDHAAFTSASREYGVPVALLAAMSHAQTRWQDHGGTPSASLGYGPMHLIDGTAADAARARADKSGSRSIDTLGEAAKLTGLSEQTLRTDAAANIRGAAAVLAAAQRARGGATGANTDPASWYAAVATTSGLTTAAAQIGHADTVMSAVRSGVSEKLADGTQLRSAARTIGSPEAQRRPLELRVDQARRGRRGGPVDAPRGLDVEWFPAPYEQYGEGAGDYGNHDLANRPRAPKITHIVVHNTEGYFDGTLTMVADPTYVSWQYTLRSSDGHIAQHLKPQDVGWHAGNWYINSHSIGLEHEGFAATGTQWFSEPMYRTSAKLVRHLCKEYRIPIDRAHIIGHDQVPAVADANIPGMHWDPGPFWDWEHYFDLLGAPLSVGVRPTPPKKGDVVRMLPGFNGNVQPLSGCSDDGDECAPNVANFVTLRVSPSADAALVNDLGLHQKGQPASTEVSDISARATAGLEFVVAEVKDDWVAIWYLGVKAWFQNPRRRPKAFVLAKRPRTITAAGATGRVYGTCYPEASAYKDPADVVAVKPLLYSFEKGQEYVVTGKPVTDYYKAKTFSLDTPNDHIDIVGKDKYLQITFGHRAAFVRVEEVTSPQR
ncbi:N-acetylmuramoyl-L-alanine amidase [Dermacoccaceae bacterium W4C1]